MWAVLFPSHQKINTNGEPCCLGKHGQTGLPFRGIVKKQDLEAPEKVDRVCTKVWENIAKHHKPTTRTRSKGMAATLKKTVSIRNTGKLLTVTLEDEHGGRAPNGAVRACGALPPCPDNARVCGAPPKAPVCDELPTPLAGERMAIKRLLLMSTRLSAWLKNAYFQLVCCLLDDPKLQTYFDFGDILHLKGTAWHLIHHHIDALPAQPEPVYAYAVFQTAVATAPVKRAELPDSDLGILVQPSKEIRLKAHVPQCQLLNAVFHRAHIEQD